MKTQVWKFPLEIKDGIQEVEMPHCSEILKVGSQVAKPFIWALVDTERKKEIRRFEVHGTGHDIEYNSSLHRIYLGTIGIPLSWEFVWHVFEIRKN